MNEVTYCTSSFPVLLRGNQTNMGDLSPVACAPVACALCLAACSWESPNVTSTASRTHVQVGPRLEALTVVGFV